MYIVACLAHDANVIIRQEAVVERPDRKLLEAAHMHDPAHAPVQRHTLPARSRAGLRAALVAGALLASLSGAVRLFNEPLAQAARLAGALQDKAAQDPSVIGGAGTAAPDLVEAAVQAEESAQSAPGADASADADSTTSETSDTTA